MADCGEIVINCPDLTCEADIASKWAELCTELQSAIDQLKACIESYECPECDICVIKDDLVDCPLECTMVNFSGVAYGDVGGVCQLPYPTRAGLDFRHGVTTTGTKVSQCSWISHPVVFDIPFDTICYGAAPVTAAVGSGEIPVGEVTYVIRDETKTGFTAWVMLGTCEDAEAEKYVTFKYLAWGL